MQLKPKVDVQICLKAELTFPSSHRRSLRNQGAIVLHRRLKKHLDQSDNKYLVYDRTTSLMFLPMFSPTLDISK